jgi:hypothetical protein
LQIVFVCCAILQMSIWFFCFHTHREQTRTALKLNVLNDIPDDACTSSHLACFILHLFSEVMGK